MKNYTPFHLHSDRSLLDSCTNYKDYINKAVELGIKSIGFSEHGNIYNWIEKKMYCDEKGIKYLHGCEIYLTETFDTKIRDNMHTILIAKNSKGVLELNELIDLSTKDDHVYYKNRLSFDEFLNISDNIIKISACMASPLNRLDEDNKYYEKLLKHYDYYEIQYHKDRKGDQISFNKKLYELSQKYNKPLIAGTDTHSLSRYKAKCRYILKKGKKMAYDDEDLFDLTFKSYDELVDKFKEQNSLPLEVVLEAIENTNIMADSCEDVVLDPSVKYPIMSEDDVSLFEKTIYDKLKNKIKNGIIDNKNKTYLERINEEIRVFKKLNMCSFMLFMSELCTWCLDNNIPIGNCRGSVGGSLIAYILDIIDLDPIQWNTVFSRFCNEDREEVGDIDIDFSPSQRKLVYEYIINKFGTDKSAYILAIGTISDKGTIDDIGRALSYEWEENNDYLNKLKEEFKDKMEALKDDGYGQWATENYYYERINKIKNSSDNPYSLNNISIIKNEYEKNPDKAKDDYPELFYYFDGLIGTAISQSVHPAGIVASPITLPDNYGTFWKDGERILQINMEEVHDGAGLVKYDILGLKNIEIIKDTCELAGINYPKSKDINWVDSDVWKHITDSNVGIFQFEGSFAFELLKRFKPKKINDLSLVNASLRPSGTSYRDRLIDGEFNNNPSEIIDDLLKDNNGFLVFQEDTIAFLQQICGLSGSEADNIRRAIGRKQKDRLDKAMPSILEGYCSKSDKPRDIAEQEAKEFLQIIEDSSNYQFGFNHSTGYSMIGYTCGYLRHYHPLEFTCAYLNNAGNEGDIQEGTKLASLYNIKINPPRFGYSKAKYHPDKETNSIFKGIGSIKFLNEQVGDELYNLRNNTYNNFLELLKDLSNTSINSRQLDILIKLDFFLQYGKSKYLLDIVDIYSKLNGKKQFKKDNIPFNLDSEIVRQYAGKETEKMFTQVNTDSLIEYMIKTIPNVSVPIKDIFEAELEYVGYISYKNDSYTDRVCVVTEVKENKWGTVFVTLYKLNNGNSMTLKVDKKYFANKPLEVYDIINVGVIEEKFKRRKVEGKWTVTEDKEYILSSYSRIIED